MTAFGLFRLSSRALFLLLSSPCSILYAGSWKESHLNCARQPKANNVIPRKRTVAATPGRAEVLLGLYIYILHLRFIFVIYFTPLFTNTWKIERAAQGSHRPKMNWVRFRKRKKNRDSTTGIPLNFDLSYSRIHFHSQKMAASNASEERTNVENNFRAVRSA